MKSYKEASSSDEDGKLHKFKKHEEAHRCDTKGCLGDADYRFMRDGDVLATLCCIECLAFNIESNSGHVSPLHPLVLKQKSVKYDDPEPEEFIPEASKRRVQSGEFDRGEGSVSILIGSATVTCTVAQAVEILESLGGSAC